MHCRPGGPCGRFAAEPRNLCLQVGQRPAQLCRAARQGFGGAGFVIVLCMPWSQAAAGRKRWVRRQHEAQQLHSRGEVLPMPTLA